SHRVQGNEHDLLLLFGRHDLSALIITAVGANVVRQYRLLAACAILNLHRLEVQVTTSFALTGVRGSSLRNSHDFRLPQDTRVKRVIVGQPLESVKIPDCQPAAPAR